jgi:hypothetical protein
MVVSERRTSSSLALCKQEVTGSIPVGSIAKALLTGDFLPASRA